MLQQCFKGYSNLDPPEKQQKAIPFSVLRTMILLAAIDITSLDYAIAELTMGAFFFAMRSCEYSKSGKEESKRTRILCLRNIRFFKNRVQIPHDSPLIHIADYVDITFEFQKNDLRNDSVGMYRSTSGAEYCAVSTWAKIVTRLWSYEGTTMDTKVNTAMYKNAKGKLIKTEISSYRIRTKIRAAVKAIGKEKLGFESTDVGCHSIRSGAAMALYLGHVPVLTIMIIGRWKSDAFLRYIRKQVALFSENLTDRMLDVDSFFTTPDFDRVQQAASSSSPTPPLNTENGPSRSWGVYHHQPAIECH